MPIRMESGCRKLESTLSTAIHMTALKSLMSERMLVNETSMAASKSTTSLNDEFAAPAVPPAVCTALHVLRSSKVPSVARYVIETTFDCGFESYSAHHLFMHLRGLESLWNHFSGRVQQFSNRPSASHRSR